MKKRIISLILAVLMIVTLLPMSAFAMKYSVTITQQPQSITVRPGESATFTISAKGSGNNLYYLWFDADIVPVDWLESIALDSVSDYDTFLGHEKGTILVSSLAAKHGFELFDYYHSHPEVPSAVFGGDFEPNMESSSITINNCQKTMHIQCIAVLNNKNNLSQFADMPFSLDTFLGMTDMKLTGYALSDVVTLTVDPNAPCQNHTMVNVAGKPATCTETGFDAHQECSVCGYSTATVIPMLPHSFGEWVTDKNPGCTEAGSMSRKCAVCGAVETEIISAEGHSFGEWVIGKDSSCTEAGFKTRSCTVCGEVEYDSIPAEGHVFGEWTQIAAPTCTANGTDIRYCMHCKATETRKTDALNHSFKNGVCTLCGEKDPDFKPSAPKISVSNDPATGRCTLKWSSVSGAAKYEIYRATSKTGTYTKMTTTTKTSYTNTTCKAGTTYYYKIKAVSAAGVKSSYSNIVSRMADCAQPVVTLSNVASTGKIKLTWSAVTGATKYEIYRATSKTGTYTKLTTTTGTSYTNTSAKAGKTYYYKVKAKGKSSSADSAYSAIVSRTCDLAKPTVKITLSSGDPKLSWAKIDNATKYEIYRATSKSGTYTKLTSTTKTSYVNTSAKAGKTYYYKVKAVCGTSAAASAYSSVVSIKAK